MKNNYLSLCLIIRNLFQNKNRTDAEQLGRLVEYVRKNIQHLDSLPTEHVLQDGRITWLPLNEQFEEGDKEDNDWFGLTFWSSDLQAVDWISTNTTFNWFFFVKLIQFDLSLRSNLKSLVYSSEFRLRIVVFSFTLTLKKIVETKAQRCYFARFKTMLQANEICYVIFKYSRISAKT